MRVAVETLGRRKQRRLVEAWSECAPRVVDARWALDESFIQGARWFVRDAVNQIRSTLILCTEWIDGKVWLHLSISHVDKTPTWDELLEAKRHFMGTNTKAISVIPPAAEHYNHHEHCLHLFACLDGDPLPDFRDAKGRV